MLTAEANDTNRIWDILTSHKAVLTYAIILTAAVAAIMILIIVRDISDAKMRERDKKRRGDNVRFNRLTELDENAARLRSSGGADYKGDLTRLCEEFRNFAASQMGLYYEISTIRAFISSLAVTKLVILQGMSGTGKTSLPYAFGKFVDSSAAIIPVQPSWKDKTDMLGYYNEFTDNFTETELLCKLYEANIDDRVHMAVLDEMNIARVEYYFAEFLSLLELPDPKSRLVEVISSRRKTDPELLKDGKLLIPENVWFIGTANNDDSTLAISDKVYDRSMVLELSRRATPFIAPETEPLSITYKKLTELFHEAEAAHISEISRARIEQLDEYLIDKLQITFGNRVMRQTEKFVPVYASAGGSETEAIDLILCKKVLRKLENLNPVYVGSKAEDLLEKIKELFGEKTMPLCTEYVSRYIRS